MDNFPAAYPIRVTNLTFRYFASAPPALKDISFAIPAASRVAILGPTGAGKSTLLQILSGIGGNFTTASATGRVEIGTQIFQPIPRSVLFPTVGFFMQDPSVQLSGIHETVEEEISFTLRNLGLPREERSRRAAQILSEMKLVGLAKRHPLRISGGELQKILLASLLAAKPSVLLLDEPANSLDSGAQHVLAMILRSLRDSTVLFTDYQIDFALRIADLFLVMDNSQMVFSGNRSSFLEHLPDFSHILPVDQWVEIMQTRPDPNKRPFKVLRKQ